jgi:hypothetical protein
MDNPSYVGVGLVVAIPFGYKVVHRSFARSLACMAYPIGTSRAFTHVDDQPLDIAREVLAEKAIANGAKYMLFWDDDIDAPSHGLRYLLATMEQYSDVLACAGIYSARSEPCEPCVFRGVGQGPFWKWKVGEIFEVDAIGPGFMLINLAKLQSMVRPWFQFVDESSADPNAEVQQVTTTEDMYFARKAKAAGHRILAHGGVLCKHCDRKSGNVYEIPTDSFPFLQ